MLRWTLRSPINKLLEKWLNDDMYPLYISNPFMISLASYFKCTFFYTLRMLPSFEHIRGGSFQ